MARTAALALVLLAVMGGEAQATAFRVVMVPGLSLADLAALEERGAVGLLVPNAGPETSAALARAALARGEARNSLRGPARGPELVDVDIAAAAPAAGPAIVLGLPEGGRQENDRRYPIAVLGGGYEGLLLSDSTRIPGLVSVADVAPTALGHTGGLSFRPHDEAAARLLALDERIGKHNEARVPATVLACALVALLALVFPRAAVVALAAALAANLALGATGTTALWAVLLAVGLATAVAAPLLALIVRPALPLGLVLAAVVGAYLLALALDGAAVALSPFGPTQNARFHGMSNLLGTMLLVPAFGAAAALGARLGPLAFWATAALALVTVAGNRFGADGGGAVVLAAGFGVLAYLLAPGAQPRRLALSLAGVTFLAVIVVLDLRLGPATHVTRAVEEGPGGLADDFARRLHLSLERLADRWYVGLLLLAGALLAAVLAVRVAGSAVPRGRKALPLAVAAALAVSLVVNDSPNDVVLVGLASFLAAAAAMLRGSCADAWSSLPPSSSSPAAAAPRRSRPSPRP